MKRIKYKFLSSEINSGTDDEPIINQLFIEKDFQYSEDTLKAVKAEAYHGMYEIYDDGSPEPEAEPTAEERIAELEEALNMLLDGVTE
jgi:hypothetical protein